MDAAISYAGQTRRRHATPALRRKEATRLSSQICDTGPKTRTESLNAIRSSLNERAQDIPSAWSRNPDAIQFYNLKFRLFTNLRDWHRDCSLKQWKTTGWRGHSPIQYPSRKSSAYE